MANRAPVPVIAYPDNILPGVPFIVDASGSSDPDGLIRRYRWQVINAVGAIVYDTIDIDGPKASLLVEQAGVYTLKLIVTDNAGASRSTTKPLLVGYPPLAVLVPADISITPTDLLMPAKYPDVLVSGGVPPYNVTFNPLPGTLFPIGTTPVTATVTDSVNQTMNCTFNVHVKEPNPLVLILPSNIFVANEDAADPVTFAASATGGIAPYTFTYSPESGTVFDVGITAVNVTVRSADGQEKIGSFFVEVEEEEEVILHESPNGTVGITVTDNNLDVWTLGDFHPTDSTVQQILKNGVAVGDTGLAPIDGYGNEYLYWDHSVYVLTYSHWFQWTGTGFIDTGTTPPYATDPIPSPDPEPDPVPEPDPTPDPEPEPEPEPDPIPIPEDPVYPAADSPVALGVFPRMLLTPTSVVALRQQIASDSTFRARWQTAVTQFENGKWSDPASDIDSYNRAFAAFLTLVRRPDNDLGLTWQSSWQTYRDRIVTAALTWSTDYKPHTIGICLVYDCLYNDLTAAERTQFGTMISQISKGSPLGHGSEAWDNGNSDGHVRAVFASIVAPDALQRMPIIYADTKAVAESNAWMPLGFGLGREWHDGYPSRNGLMFTLHCLKNAGGYTDAQTMDLMAVHLRDVWVLTALATIPSLSNDIAADPYWTSEKFHTQDTLKAFHRTLNVASHMLWSAAIMPGSLARGAVTLDGIANSQADYFGYLAFKMNEPLAVGSDDKHINVTNYGLIGIGSATPSDGKQNTFWSFPTWLIYNVQLATERTADEAGIPTVRRWWPGTTDWTMVQSNHSRTERTALWYLHRRYGASTYEEGTRFNGSWSLHRNGPLLMRRSATGHSYVSRRATWAVNGGVSFVDASLYPEFTAGNSDNEDLGGQRAAYGNGDTKTHILANTYMDFGQVTAWHDTGNAVALTSDLTRSYNSSLVRTPGTDETYNARKISSFIREFVRVYDDGTGRGKVFTYDRIALLDTRFEPRYSICPATNPTIDGSETAHTPFGSGVNWNATGPTRWDYNGATKLIVSNDVEPATPIPGNGKVCVTWLRPTSPVVRKWGGHNVDDITKSNPDGDPHIGMWNEWHGTSDYASANSPALRAYVGSYTVTISPSPVSLDTRFLIACEDMTTADTPSQATEVPCDANSVAVKCGPTVVVFGKDGERSSGWVNVPSGVTLLIVCNLTGQNPQTLPVPGAGGIINF